MTELMMVHPLAWSGASPAGSTSLPGSGAAPQSGGGGQAVEGVPGDGGAGNGGAAPAGGLMQWFLPVMIAMLALMIFTSFSSQRKEKKRREQLLSGIGRSDRVQTVGGIIGTVAEVHGDEIVLKVDDNTNTRIRFARSSVQQVLRSAKGDKGERTDNDDSGKDAA